MEALQAILKAIEPLGLADEQVYLRGDVLLVNADCLRVLPLLPSGCVDAVVTDPVWPNAPDGMFPGIVPLELFDKAMSRVPRDVKRLAVQIGCNSDPRFLNAIPAHWPFFRACWLEYVRPGYLGRLLYTSDLCYMFGDPPAVRKGNFVISGYCQLVDSKRERFDHPCIRQRQHVEWVVEKWTTRDEVVCDPFSGTATTAAACLRTGRKFIGCEIDPKHFATAKDRLDAEFTRLALLEPPPPRVTQAELFTEAD